MSDREQSTFYSVDVEASGPVPGLYNLISVGATVVSPDPSGEWCAGETFYVELRPVFAGHVAAANAIHGLDLKRLAREGLEPAEAMGRLTRFVTRTCGEGRRPVFVGHVAVFDWMFIAWYFAWCGMENPFGYKGIDTKSLAMGQLGLSWEGTSKEELSLVLEIAPQEQGSLHRADADAAHQAELFARLLNRESADGGRG